MLYHIFLLSNVRADIADIHFAGVQLVQRVDALLGHVDKLLFVQCAGAKSRGQDGETGQHKDKHRRRSVFGGVATAGAQRTSERVKVDVDKRTRRRRYCVCCQHSKHSRNAVNTRAAVNQTSTIGALLIMVATILDSSSTSYGTNTATSKLNSGG